MNPRVEFRVLHLIASNFVGGPEKQILRHVMDDQSDNVELWIGSFRDGDQPTEMLIAARESGLCTVEIESGHLIPVAIINLAKLLKKKEISILCTHGYKANVIGFAATRVAGLPHVAFVRGWTGENLKVRIYDSVERLVLRWADRVVCVSRVQALQVTKTRWRKRVPVVIPNATTLSLPYLDNKRKLRALLGLGFESYVVLAAGRLSPEKGHRFLLEAASKLKSRIESLQIVILGAGPELERLKQQRKALALEDCVTFGGFRKNISDWLQASDVLVNPSLTEGMPNVVLEGMAAGLAIVATAVGAVPDMIENGRSGLVVEAGSAQQVCDAIFRLASEPSFATILGKAAKERSNQFSPQFQREALRGLYSEILGLDLAHSNRQSLESFPLLSVVVPVRNEADAIGGVLTQLMDQEYPRDRYEIIVVDGRSTDATREIVNEMARNSAVPIRLTDNPGMLSSAGRNVGIKNSHGDVVAFIDGHCNIPTRRLLNDMATIMAETGADCLARPQPLTIPDNNFIQSLIAHVRSTTLGHGTDSTIFSTGKTGFVNPTSSGAIYRKKVFDQIGIYDESFDACEDVDFNFRVKQSGLTAFIDPRLTILYEPRKSLLGLFKQMVRYGKGRFRLLAKHPSSWSLGQMVPPALFLFAAVTVLSVVFRARIPLMFLLGWILYLGAILFSSAGLAFKKDLRYFLGAPPAYFAIHFGLGYGFWIEVLLRIRNVFSRILR